ncbi:MAG: pyridoxal phosphate-dependent aminotransferase [Clostridiales bacterium]|nr:pyridoxal phosphate-dependent aminotransferase [Clostridiales bacterium]
MQISKRAKQVTGSLTLAIDAKAKAMIAEGVDVVSFGAGEPDYDTPKHIREAAIAAMERGETRYTPSSGTLALRKAVCEKLEKRNGLSYEPSQIVISSGAKHSLYNTVCAILEEGDEVIILPPAWVSYPEMVKMAGGVPVYAKCDENNRFAVSADAIRSVVTEKTRAIMLNSPCNPTGEVIPYEILLEIAKIAKEYDLWIISDEIYEEFAYDGPAVPSIATLDEETKGRTILINGVSKTYAMTGWRIGYLAAPQELAKAIGNWQSHATSNPNSIAQAAALAAISGPQDCVGEMVAEFDERRKIMQGMLQAIDGVNCPLPRGAFYCLADIRGLLGKSYNGKVITTDDEFAAVLLEEKAVAVVPGSGFMAPGYIRLSYALGRENIVKGITRIAEFAKELV